MEGTEYYNEDQISDQFIMELLNTNCEPMTTELNGHNQEGNNYEMEESDNLVDSLDELDMTSLEEISRKTLQEVDTLEDISTIDLQAVLSFPFHSNSDSETPNSSPLSASPFTSTSPPSTEEQSPKSLCQVCFVGAAHHIHYGGLVCSSCRGFFRRSTTNQTAETFRCLLDKSCPINPKSRKSCVWCRYQKCLAAGMNPKWIMTKEERKVIALAKRTRQVMLNHPLVTNPSMPLTTEEELFLESLVSNMILQYQTFLCNLLKRDPTPIFLIREQLLLGKNPPAQLLLKFEQNNRRLFEEVVVNLSDFGQVDAWDRPILIEANHGLFFITYLATFFNGQDGFYHITRFRNFLKNKVTEDSVFSMFIKLWDEVDRQDRWGFLNCDLLYSSAFKDHAVIGKRYKGLVSKLQEWPRLSPKQPLNETMGFLNVVCMIFSSDGLKLKNPKVIDSLQEKYSMLLYRYMKAKIGQKAGPKFGSALTMHSVGREAYAMHKKLIPQIY